MRSYYSILRENEYRQLSELTFSGTVLDVGGTHKADYHERMRGTYAITTINISEDADVVSDIQKKFPFEDTSYDYAVCLNVFEHVYGFQNGFSEIHRVLKPNGTFVFSTPFMHHIHGCPDDYFRYTDSALKKVLSDNGFTHVDIRPIGCGLFSLIHQTISGMFPWPIKRVSKFLSTGLDRILMRLSGRYTRMSERIPLGYFVIAKK